MITRALLGILLNIRSTFKKHKGENMNDMTPTEILEEVKKLRNDVVGNSATLAKLRKYIRYKSYNHDLQKEGYMLELFDKHLNGTEVKPIKFEMYGMEATI